MKRWYYSGISILILSLMYLCYRSCNTDTSTHKGSHSICIPDSSWLSATIDLRSIRNEIAWNTLLNGNIQALFKADTNNNTLIQILKSPADFNIHEGSPVYYFSKWNSDIQQHGFILSLQNSTGIMKRIGGTPALSIAKDVYTARTTEGFWIYDEQQVLFLLATKNDSINAISYFYKTPVKDTTTLPDSVRIALKIDTRYIPAHHCSPLLDSIRLSVQLSSQGKNVYASWTYQGIFDNFAENAALTKPVKHSGIYYTARHSSSFFKTIQSISPAADSIYTVNKELADHFVQVLEHNTIQAYFNGWDQLKSSYYVSEMNDEFETILKKKDTSLTEPVFQIQLEQPNEQQRTTFLSYVQKQGLVSLQKKGVYKLVPGNFDSELSIQKDNSLLLKNKHHKQHYIYSTPANAAFIVDLDTEILTQTNISPAFVSIVNALSSIEHIYVSGTTSSQGIEGNIILTYKENEYPLLQLLKSVSLIQH